MFNFFVRKAKKSISDQRHRAAVRDLSALDDRTLQDIGLRRSQFTPVAKGFDPHQL